MNKTKKLLKAFLISVIGVIIFKYIPMQIWGQDILFDASSHVIWTIFGLYLIWEFIEKHKEMRLPYFIFSCSLITIISIQRIFVGAHNETGILLGLGIGLASIITAEGYKKFF